MLGSYHASEELHQVAVLEVFAIVSIEAVGSRFYLVNPFIPSSCSYVVDDPFSPPVHGKIVVGHVSEGFNMFVRSMVVSCRRRGLLCGVQPRSFPFVFVSEDPSSLVPSFVLEVRCLDDAIFKGVEDGVPHPRGVPLVVGPSQKGRAFGQFRSLAFVDLFDPFFPG